MPIDKDIVTLRHEIDGVDENLVNLLNTRATLASSIAVIKRKEGEETVYYRPEREAKILERIKKLNNGPLSGETIALLFREIMSACLAQEQLLNIAYLGPETSFCHMAALKHFGKSVDLTGFAGIDLVFGAVETDSCHFGIVPIENSTEGAVNHTLDLLVNTPLKVCGEVILPIHHYLLAKMEAISAIRKVYGHQQALAQCRGWLDKNLPHAERIEVYSNPEGARQASLDEKAAAIAGKQSSEYYDLRILAKHIEDSPNNVTRFLVLGKQALEPGNNDKTTLILYTENKEGALCKALSSFAEHQINITWIQSRPSRSQPWGYLFFIDITGHIQHTDVSLALSTLTENSSAIKLLGSYPMRVI